MARQKPRVNVSKRQRSTRAEDTAAPTEPAYKTREQVVAERKRRKQVSEGPSLEALFGAMIAFPLGYLAVEGVMNDNRHPIHWLVTAIVGALGYVVGQFIYRWKESH